MDIVKRLKQEPPSYTMDFDAADEIERLRAELAEVKKPDCADCTHLLVRAYGNHGCELHPTCVNGDKFSDVVDRADRPIRLYEINAAMAGGEK